MNIYPPHFTAIDRTPFFYVMTHKSTGKRYAGSKTRKGCKPEDLGVSYFSSSKLVKQLIRQEGIAAFSYRVLRIFDDPDNCRKHETKFLQRINAAKRNDWFNQTNSDGKFTTAGKTSWNKGLSPSKETRLRISNTLTGSKRKSPSLETKNKIAMALKGQKHSSERIRANSLGHIGKTHSSETKAKMRKPKLRKR